MFKLGDIVVKEVLYAIARNIGTLEPLYILTQLSEASINITAESSDVTDKNGNVVARIFRSKNGEFQAVNAFLNTNILAASGATATVASADAPINLPKIVKVKKSDRTLAVDELVDGTVTINQYYGDGRIGKAYTLGSSASATEFAITAPSGGETVSTITLPTDNEAEYYLVIFTRKVSEGAKIVNSANEFPDSVDMLLKVTYYDPCNKSEVKAAYVEMPSFKVSPETTVSFNPESPTMDFNGTLEIDYCSDDKELYTIGLVDEVDAD